MDVPAAYQKSDAQTLGDLVALAYLQYELYQKGQRLDLPAGYRWVADLTYPAHRALAMEGPTAARGLAAAASAGRPVPFGLVVEDDTRLYVVYRGTESLTDWTTNLDAQMVAFPAPGVGRVHQGFLERYQSLEPALGPLLKGRGRPVAVTGHSLGGALATLAAYDLGLALGEGSLGPIYTFASPRVGDRDFQRAYDQALGARTLRIENSSDLVPEVPPPAPVLHYSHVGTPVQFNVQNNDLVQNHALATYQAALGLA